MPPPSTPEVLPETEDDSTVSAPPCIRSPPPFPPPSSAWLSDTFEWVIVTVLPCARIAPPELAWLPDKTVRVTVTVLRSAEIAPPSTRQNEEEPQRSRAVLSVTAESEIARVLPLPTVIAPSNPDMVKPEMERDAPASTRNRCTAPPLSSAGHPEGPGVPEQGELARAGPLDRESGGVGDLEVWAVRIAVPRAQVPGARVGRRDPGRW